MKACKCMVMAALFFIGVQQSDAAQPAVSGTHNGHEWVDLGLSVKWATCNVGASTPGDYGNYYAWGETSTKSEYVYYTSRTYGDGSIGDIAGNVSHDVARSNWGGSWRLPTKVELTKLKDKCTWSWTMQNGHIGYSITGPNGNSIFLPAAGFRGETSLYDAGSRGDYWSSSPYMEYSAWSLDFDSDGRYINYNSRSCGGSVRPVLE